MKRRVYKPKKKIWNNLLRMNNFFLFKIQKNKIYVNFLLENKMEDEDIFYSLPSFNLSD